MKQKIRKSERLPKYGTSLRRYLVDLVENLPGYLDGISKGFPLFTIKEMDDFRKKYKDGLTWEDIDGLLSGKGIFFKKATFRKYIQEGNISKAIGYRNTEKGRVAIFPADTISHINFIQYYYKVMDGELFDKILKVLKLYRITYLDAVESNLEHRTLEQSIRRYLCYYDEGETEDAIEKALKSRPDDRDKFLKMLHDINDKFNRIIRKDILKFESSLKKKEISIFETIDDSEEAKDEQD